MRNRENKKDKYIIYKLLLSVIVALFVFIICESIVFQKRINLLYEDNTYTNERIERLENKLTEKKIYKYNAWTDEICER